MTERSTAKERVGVKGSQDSRRRTHSPFLAESRAHEYPFLPSSPLFLALLCEVRQKTASTHTHTRRSKAHFCPDGDEIERETVCGSGLHKPRVHMLLVFFFRVCCCVMSNRGGGEAPHLRPLSLHLLDYHRCLLFDATSDLHATHRRKRKRKRKEERCVNERPPSKQ